MLIQCMWTCNRCGQAKVKCEVSERMLGEDVVKFVNRAAARCGAQHRARSPKCAATKLDIYVPVGEGGIVGGKGEADAETLDAMKKQLEE